MAASESDPERQIVEKHSIEPDTVATDSANERMSEQEAVDDAANVPQLSGIRWFSICVGLYLTAFLYGLDSTISAAIQGPILASLGDLELLPWVGTGFLLGSVATISLFGSLYNKLEVKWLYLGSILTFEVGSAICGAAPNMSVLAFARVVAGVGGTGIYLGGITYINIFVSPAKRPLVSKMMYHFPEQGPGKYDIHFYTALIGTFWGFGCVLGPVIGGAFSQSSATWRWSFYINLVLGGVTSPIYIFYFPRHGVHRHEKLLPRMKNLDYLGAILNAATYALFIVSTTYAGAIWPWNSGKVIALWVVTGVTIILFILQQGTAFLTTKEDRIYPVWCLKDRNLVMLYLGTAGSSAVLNCNIYYLPLVFEFAHGDGPIAVSARLLSFIFLMIFGALSSGALIPKLNLYAVWYVLSGAVALVGSVLLFRTSVSTPVSNIYGFEVLVGLGCGLTFQAAYSIALVLAPPEKGTSVLSFINVAQLGAGALSLATAGSVFQNIGFSTLQTALDGRGYSSTEIREALAGGYSSIISTSTPEVRAIALEAIGSTLAKVFGISLAGAAVVLVAGLLMRWERVQMA
ncbi:MFS general substrate transporter [Xylariaceae sp. FL0255]|nr:MFS general substrate transporter [Xylariaceae sp. FL0255]